MKKLSVLQLSKRTGLSRTQIYYLEKKNKINIINGKIDLDEAMLAITDLLDKKSNKDNEINFKQILNMLISQNISLQTQLNFAHERENEYLDELTIYRQHYAQKAVQIPLKSEGYIQVGQGKDVSDPNEISQYPIKSKIENQAHLESCQSTKEEIESINEAENPPLPTESIHNEITLPKSKIWDTRPKNESTEQNADALIDRSLQNQNDTKISINIKRRRNSITPIIKTKSAKPIYPTPIQTKQKVGLPTDQQITDQDHLDKKDHHDYEP